MSVKPRRVAHAQQLRCAGSGVSDCRAQRDRVAATRSRSSRSVIVTCAVTGAIHTPTMSAAPADHAGRRSREEAIGAAEAGAAILHLHARDPIDGRPSPSPALFLEFLPRDQGAAATR